MRNKVYILSLAILSFIFTSCTPALKFSSVKYDAESVNRLLDSTNMDHLILQFNSDDSKSYKNPFKLISYSLTKEYKLLSEKPYYLQMVEKTKSQNFVGPVVLGNLTVSRDEIIYALSDVATHERMKNFDFLLFTPIVDKATNHVNYYMSVAVIRTMSKLPPPKVIQPCPPAVCFNSR